ncbi:MAG: hypothetical protein M3Y82_06600, partial [Verrucomicrobiota bacterium]|nr:hypothetical protein [Verrucomicrobiota bacterium]
LYPSAKNLNYWDANQNEMWISGKFQKQVAAFEREKNDLIKELLGIDAVKEMKKIYGWNEGGREEKMLSFLPQEKSEAVKVLREKYQD